MNGFLVGRAERKHHVVWTTFHEPPESEPPYCLEAAKRVSRIGVVSGSLVSPTIRSIARHVMASPLTRCKMMRSAVGVPSASTPFASRIQLLPSQLHKDCECAPSSSNPHDRI